MASGLSILDNILKHFIFTDDVNMQNRLQIQPENYLNTILNLKLDKENEIEFCQEYKYLRSYL